MVGVEGESRWFLGPMGCHTAQEAVSVIKTK